MRQAAYLVLVTAFAVSLAMPLVTPIFAALLVVTKTRCVNVAIPAILHKIDRAVTRAILAAMFAPVFDVPGGTRK